MKLRALAIVSLLALASAFLAGCKENPHDNARVPEPSTDHPVYNHRFDGGETNPYFKPGDTGGGEGGEKGGGEKAEKPAKE